MSIIERASELLKYSYRLIRYKNQWKKLLREARIQTLQNRGIRQSYSATAENLIVFIVPGANWTTGKDAISGGVMSIVSICEETVKLEAEHKAQTIMCTLRNDHLLWRHEMFENETYVFRFSQIERYFKSIRKILIHIPEYMVDSFYQSLTASSWCFLNSASEVNINILNQNIRLMPKKEALDKFKKHFASVTITTAHQKYCSLAFREHFGCPLHKLSVWISPEQYIFKQWQEKSNILIVSPDFHPLKENIIAALKGIKNLEVKIIHNLTYEKYKELISTAKWSVTFGEGLDGYFIEPAFSGALSFAVFNKEFFTSDFECLPTVYPSYEVLAQRIVEDILNYDKKAVFEALQKQQFAICASYYSKKTYKENILQFYQGNFTYA